MLGAGQVGGSREDVEMKSNYILQFQHIQHSPSVLGRAGRGCGVEHPGALELVHSGCIRAANCGDGVMCDVQFVMTGR